MPVPSLTACAHDGTLLQLRPTQAGWAISHGRSIVGRVALEGARAELGDHPSHRPAAVTVDLDPALAGRGIASGALRAVGGWALDRNGGRFHALTASIPIGDWPSRRLFWACGFRFTGRLVDDWVASLTAPAQLSPASVWFAPPVLASHSTALRPLKDADVQRLVSGCSDQAVRIFLPDIPQPYGLEAARSFLLACEEQHAAGSHLHWAITAIEQPAQSDPGALAGVISLLGLDAGRSRAVEIGYWMHPEARRRGHTTEAIRLVARHALLPVTEGGLGMSRVLIRTSESNLASTRAAQAAGFNSSGRDRLASVLGDRTQEDHLRFDLIEADLDDTWA